MQCGDNELTLVIDGEICTVKGGDDVSFTETGNAYLVTINGTPYSIPKVTPGDDVSFTENDDEYIITINNVPHTIAKCDKGFHDCNNEYIDPCLDAIVTCDNFDTKITTVINNLTNSDLRIRSMTVSGTNLVTKQGTSSEDKQTFTVPLTASNVSYNDNDWFLTTDANTVQEALDQLSAFLSTAFGDDLIILNNPTFYIRTNGSSSPNIEKQSDLTVANAFDSFDSLKEFISRTYIVGYIRIDARGSYKDVSISATSMKNASSVTIFGDENDATALTFGISADADVGTGLLISDVDSTVKDCTFNLPNKDTLAGIYTGMRAHNCTVSLRGVVKVTGNFDKDSGSKLTSGSMFCASGNGGVSVSRVELQFAMSDGHLLGSGFSTITGGSINLGGNTTLKFQNNLKAESLFYATTGCDIVAYMTNDPQPVISGNGNFTGTYIWNLANLSTYVSSYFPGQFSSSYWPMATYASNFADYSVVNGTMGKDL